LISIFLTTTNNYLNDLTPIAGSYDSADSFGTQKVDNYSFNLDMEHPLNWIDLNYGTRFSIVETDNNYEYYDLTTGTPIFDASQSNTFEYKENTQSVYFSAQKKFNEQWSAKAGLRLENTQLKGFSPTLNQENRTDYTKLFPTTYLTFVPNDNHSFSLSYNRRINRPGYNLLNPFKWISSPYSYSEGNPALQPSFVNNIELEYIFKENYTTAFNFLYLDDDFEQITILDPQTNIQQTTPLNFMVNKTFVIYQSINIDPTERINIFFQGDVNYSDTSSKIPVTLNYLSGWSGSLYISNKFFLDKEKNFMFNCSYTHVFRGVDNLDRNSSYNKTDAYIRALFLEKKLTVTLYAYDIFGSFRPIYTTYSNNIKKSSSYYGDNRRVGLSLNYSFGKQFGINNRESKNSEEAGRTN